MEIIRQILEVRQTYRRDFGEDLAQYIEFYDPGQYLCLSSRADNIVCGDPCAMPSGEKPAA